MNSPKEIPLTKGKIALVSPEDYEMARLHKWYTSSNGYAVRTEHPSRRRIYLHRVISQTPSDMWTDHINHDKMDCTRENLRVVTPSQNHQNQRKLTIGSSRFKGVSFKRERDVWEAYIKQDGKKVALGSFETELAAASAYNARAVELWGAHAQLNQFHAL